MKILKTYSWISFNNVQNYIIYFFNSKFNSKENYLNFVIEYHFNDHSLEKLNSNTWFVNGKTFMINTWINKI
jgi:hypothetical protein